MQNNIESLIGSIIVLIILYILQSIVKVGYPNFYLRFLEKDGDVEFKHFIVSSNKILKSLGYTTIVGLIGIILAIICTVTIFAFSLYFIPALFGTVEMPIEVITSSLVAIIAIILASIVYAVFMYGVALTPYIIIENDDLGIFKAMKLSENMMKGKKWNLFVLNISFLGWGILSLLTLGIGFLWLAPYMTLSMTNFYKDIISE